QLRKNIDAVPHAVGVNNHMGSKFMMDDEKLSVIFKELQRKKLFFIDSRTSPDTRAYAIADDMGFRIAERKIFIDHHRDYHAIYSQLMHVAQSNDPAPKIIIGHPYPETVRALQAATKVMREKGVSVVPASRIIKKTNKSPEKS
ncbi:MAG TPA: divergent polysaccharide deacetylase family protein, partial [Smithella sp.]|nr:divergent polysaccharide deacetylase family protein [Smithella sp.]HPX31606.1 divergent polysaccharide deacetylase family protein [Smithella sp.]HQC19652.1 divergent polysaccharide deacetylase family protein [Smithella sp.]HQN71038.1 divergent polysaccharide deacetylase family protein [Smithella sp.]